MPAFLYRLIPPRVTFPVDMNEREGAVMAEHFAYWAELCDRGLAVVYGPVAEGEGAWGMAVLEVEDEAAASALTANDPAHRAGIGFTTALNPMPDAVLRPRVLKSAA